MSPQRTAAIIGGIRIVLIAVVFGSLWIRFVAMADDTRITDSGQACMGAFLVYILTLTSKAEDHIALMLIRRCLMICCIFVLNVVTAVDNVIDITNAQPGERTGQKVNLDWAVLCAFIIVSVIELNVQPRHFANADSARNMLIPTNYAESNDHNSDDENKTNDETEFM